MDARDDEEGGEGEGCGEGGGGGVVLVVGRE